MTNGWTGGQYSLLRIALAAYLLAHFLFSPVPATLGMPARSIGPEALAFFATPAVAMVLSAVAIVLCCFLVIGLYDRAAALGLWFFWTCVFADDPLFGWILLAHVFLPPAPYGSWAARGRVDPSGGWRMPSAEFAAAWGILALTYTFSGYSKLTSPAWRDDSTLVAWIIVFLELAFAPLVFVPPLRPWLWSVTLLAHLAILVPGGLIDRSVRLLLLHLYAWDPGWIRPLPGVTERLFYDGHCGLCQRSVRLILAEDATEAAFRFAPLEGETFAALVPAAERASLPMSLVVRTENGTLLTRSAGVLHILRRLGGAWRLLAGVLILLPPFVRNGLYDGVARIRHRLFAPPKDVCPVMPPRLRARFDP